MPESLTDNDVFAFCRRARSAGYAITAFTPAELRGCDPFEVTDRLVFAGNEYIQDNVTVSEVVDE